jgi:hypothetical protein
MGNVCHVGDHFVNFELVVHCQADVQTMDRLSCFQGALAGDDEVVGFDVGQGGFDVPQAIFSLKA